MTDKYIGLMSGTSLDGIDAVLVRFQDSKISLLDHHSHPIPEHLRQKLLDLAHNHPNLNLDNLGEADAELGEVFAAAVKQLLNKSGHSSNEICAIGSHGQTIRHRPDVKFPFTMQIGDPNRIAHLTGITTIADFRRHDMAAGGQGAPLVPAFHQAMFSNPEENRVILNIGGIANITYLPCDKRTCTGFDTGPGNMLMDAWIQHHQKQHYDKNGAWAASSIPNNMLLDKLMADNFIHQQPPKSTGREHYNFEWLKEQLNDFPDLPPATVQASLCTFTATTISHAIKTFLSNVHRVLVCGGGAHNHRLMKELSDQLHPIKVESTEHYGLHPDWVEAVAFAWLAKQRINNEPGNLPQVTGAHRPVILGGIYSA